MTYIYTYIYCDTLLTHTCMYIYNIYYDLKHTLTLPPPVKKAMTPLPVTINQIKHYLNIISSYLLLE